MGFGASTGAAGITALGFGAGLATGRAFFAAGFLVAARFAAAFTAGFFWAALLAARLAGVFFFMS